MTVINNIRYWLRRLWFASYGMQIHPTCRLGPHASLNRGYHNGRNGTISLGPECEISQGACLHAWGGHILLAPNVFVGPYVVIYGHGGINIGAGTLVSMHCCILSSNHSVPPYITDIRSQPDVLLSTRIGRDVWLGAGVTVLGGISIGDGCVVGAGAVVTKDLPPGAIAHGIPATIQGWREGAPQPTG